MLPEVEKELEMFDSFNDYQIFGPLSFFYGKLFYFLCEKAQNALIVPLGLNSRIPG